MAWRARAIRSRSVSVFGGGGDAGAAPSSASRSMNAVAAPPTLARTMKTTSRTRRTKTPSALPPTWLVGKKVRLRTVEPADVPALHRWINTSSAREWLITRWPFSEAAEQDWAARASLDSQQRAFIIQTRGGADIGVIGLIGEGSRATLGIAIHDERYWNGGYGTEAVEVLVDGAFRVLPLERIELKVYTDNPRAIRCYTKAGFRREGVLRSYEFHEGRHADVVVMSILRPEWVKKRSGR